MGFTPEQIGTFEELRADGHHLEWTDNRRQFDALRFLRWRIRERRTTDE